MKLATSLLLLAATFSASSFAEEKSAPKEDKKPKEVTVTGIFEAIQSTDLMANTKQLSSLKLKKIVPHGTAVKKGQTIFAFDTKAVDKKIKEAAAELQLAKITMESDKFDFEQFKATQVLDKAIAERSWQRSRQLYDNFQETDKDRIVKSAEFSLKSSKASLANAMEELEQLEQMYKEDDLTEESEEIVLKRAQQSVDSAKYRLESSMLSNERAISQTLPAQIAQQEDSLARAELAHAKAIRGFQVARAKRDIDMNKKHEAFAKKQADFDELQKERKHLVITAAHDGIVYHGKLTRGKLSDKPSTLKVDSTVTGKQVFATLVNPARLQIRTDLTEALLKQVSKGQQGTAKSNAYDTGELKVKVRSIGSAPYANNKFDCVLSVGKTAGILPGTSCVVKLPIED